jgi:TPR repeat protein
MKTTLGVHLVVNSIVVFGLAFFALGCSEQQVTELKARMGNAEAQFDLAEMYYNAEGGEKNDELALKWYRNAAEQGHANAQVELGLMFCQSFTGCSFASSDLDPRIGRFMKSGVTEDNVEAVKWFRKAANHGHAEAQYLLWSMNEAGDVTARDQWLRMAAEQGLPSAQFTLGNFYRNGARVAQDSAEAAKWYREAAEQGHAKAQFSLGAMYGRGEGFSVDSAEAAKWYREAADQGDADAQYNLGLAYDYGRGVAENDAEAVKWYRKAAEQGGAEAQGHFGSMYTNGTGIAQNDVLAHMWTNLARAQGNEVAGENMQLLINRMTPEQIAEAQRLATEWQVKHSSTEGD